MTDRAQLKNARRWVIKIGSALLTQDGAGLDLPAIQSWVDQIAVLLEQGMEVVLVSSGAVAEGMSRLNWNQRPHALHDLQAAAAVGQMGLIQTWESCFSKHGRHTAQILLTHEDLSNRKRYLNARSTIRSLLALGVVPVINENDTVAIDEICFGDNDTLAALAANLVEADNLVILTDQNGLFDRDPRQHSDAKLISESLVSDPSLEAMAEGGAGSLGRGGMATKVRAARLAARSGASTLIASGRVPDVLSALRNGKEIGSLLTAGEAVVTAVLDAGAINVLHKSGRSLLAVGVVGVEGAFTRGDMVACVDSDGQEVARGLVNYAAAEVGKIMGQPSDKIEALLGYVDEAELIHRDNLVLVE